MNTLSWLIYLSGTADRASGIFGGILFIVGIMGGVAVCVSIVFAAVERQSIPHHGKAVLAWALVSFLAMVGHVATPSSETILMIAASETGEMVVNTPEAREMLGDLKEIIRRKLKEELGDKAV